MFTRIDQSESEASVMRRPLALLGLLAALSVASVGCNFFYDLDSVELPAHNRDAGDVHAADVGDDADTGAALACRPSTQEGCEAGEQCVVEWSTGAVSCTDAANFGSGVQGEACATHTDCEPGLLCVDWELPDTRGTVCSEPCRRSTGEGCELGEFCTAPSGDALPGDLGFCSVQCDIFEPNASCPDGEQCTPDPSDLGGGFPAFSRCLSNGGASEKAIGAECNADELDADGCPDGLACLPVKFQGSVGEFCLQPCRSFDDCRDASVSYSTCASIEGSTNVGYCSP